MSSPPPKRPFWRRLSFVAAGAAALAIAVVAVAAVGSGYLARAQDDSDQQDAPQQQQQGSQLSVTGDRPVTFRALIVPTAREARTVVVPPCPTADGDTPQLDLGGQEQDGAQSQDGEGQDGQGQDGRDRDGQDRDGEQGQDRQEDQAGISANLPAGANAVVVPQGTGERTLLIPTCGGPDLAEFQSNGLGVVLLPIGTTIEGLQSANDAIRFRGPVVLQSGADTSNVVVPPCTASQLDADQAETGEADGQADRQDGNQDGEQDEGRDDRQDQEQNEDQDQDRNEDQDQQDQDGDQQAADQVAFGGDRVVLRPDEGTTTVRAPQCGEQQDAGEQQQQGDRQDQQRGSGSQDEDANRSDGDN